jgi:hypothetical protein
MGNISVKGLFIAFAIALAIDIAGGIIALPLFASEMTEEALEALFHQIDVIIYMLTVGTSSSFVGGYVCAKYAELAPYKNALIFSFVGIILSLVLAKFDPAWVDIVGCLLIVPAALLGAQLAAKKNA